MKNSARLCMPASGHLASAPRGDLAVRSSRPEPTPETSASRRARHSGQSRTASGSIAFSAPYGSGGLADSLQYAYPNLVSGGLHLPGSYAEGSHRSSMDVEDSPCGLNPGGMVAPNTRPVLGVPPNAYAGLQVHTFCQRQLDTTSTLLCMCQLPRACALCCQGVLKRTWSLAEQPCCSSSLILALLLSVLG